jgi:hypothetical protein
MIVELYQNQKQTLANDPKTMKRIEIALKKSKELDQTEMMDLYSKSFSFAECERQYWNPEPFSLLYDTPLWHQASQLQKVRLNQMFWVAYYSQIISAEIATIFFNQTSAAALYAIEDFRPVCDTLDLESAQERAHIHAFKTVSEQVELELFGERIFTYPMRTPFVKTMLYSDLNKIQQWIRTQQLRAFTVLSSNSAFLGCQYFTVRGLRTLNGKIVQHQLSKFFTGHPAQEKAPIPSKISYSHFLDESFHFNTSTIISHDALHSVPKPNKFESMVGNMTIMGCQKDHYHFSTAINGIFWHDPAMFPTILKLLQTPVFGMNKAEALDMIYRCFCEESEGMHSSARTHRQSIESYKAYLADFSHLNVANKEMHLMSSNSLEKHLATNRKAFKKFRRQSEGK